MSKVEFMRQGEATLEKFYPPWMKVVYFRYLRFFPDGLVYMHTSPLDPASVVKQLKSPSAQLEGMCRGMYRLKDGNQVSILSCIRVVTNFFKGILNFELFMPFF